MLPIGSPAVGVTLVAAVDTTYTRVAVVSERRARHGGV